MLINQFTILIVVNILNLELIKVEQARSKIFLSGSFVRREIYCSILYYYSIPILALVYASMHCIILESNFSLIYK